MRSIEKINNSEDIYQPVGDEDIQLVEYQLDFLFPREYQSLLRTPDIELLDHISTLFWFVHHPSVGVLEVNAELRHREHDPFPKHLIAFATNECGDFFCFDKKSGLIIYIDPDRSIEENLTDDEFVFASFKDWLDYQSKQKR